MAMGSDEDSSKSYYSNVVQASHGAPDFSVSYDEDAAIPWNVSKEARPLMKVHQEAQRALREQQAQQAGFSARYSAAINWGRQVQEDLMELVKKYAPPETPLVPNMDPSVLINIVADIFDSYQRKFALFDISFDGLHLLEGTALQAIIDESKKKVSEILESYQQRLKDAEYNVWHLEGIIKENMELIKAYENRVGVLYDQVLTFQGRTFDVPEQEEFFFKQLKTHLEHDRHLNSSFKEELAKEKRSNHTLLKEICRLQELRIIDEQEKMKDFAEMSKDFQLDWQFTRMVTDKIETLSADPLAINKGIEEWMRLMESIIAEKQGQILRSEEMNKYLENYIAENTTRYFERCRLFEEIVESLNTLEAEILEKWKILKLKRGEAVELDEMLGELDTRSAPLGLSPAVPHDATSATDRGRTLFDGGSRQKSMYSTPMSVLPPRLTTPHLPIHTPSPVIPRYDKRGAAVGPSTSQARNRINVGKSFNMRTVSQTSTPYRQITRVESQIPESGGSGRMIDRPLKVTHSAQLTPTQYATPPSATTTSTRSRGFFSPKNIFRKRPFNLRRLYRD